MAPKVKKRHKAAAESESRSLANLVSSKPSPPSGDVGESSTTCSICAEPARDWAVGNCSHVICGDCSHRMRVLYNRKTCVMCNEMLPQVAVIPLRYYRNGMTFHEAVALTGVFQDKQVDMWFIDRSRHQQLRHVRGFKCSHRTCGNRAPQDSVFANATQLRAHARSEHRTIYCEICFAGKKLFVSEMQQYSLDNERNYSSRLRGHLRKDHPQCKFCRHYYLDDEKLYAHLQERHETCSVCERNGRMHEYYLNFEQLERHYAKEHYVCNHESCRGVVFSTQIELQSHEHSRHNEGPRGNRSRAFRVDLAQLHGARDPQRSSSGTLQEVERERERQAARRRAFLSSNVVFSGAFNSDESAGDPLPGEGSEPSSEQAPSRPVSAPLQSSAGDGADAFDAVQTTRPPDDGRFHPLDLPRNCEELHARNTILVRMMRSLLDPAAYEQFKNSSGQFRVGSISADEFYDAAVDAFGVRSAIRDILPELVALLPSHLLREPLLQTCMRRTDTKAEDVGYLGMTTTASNSASVGSFNNTNTRDEQFPSLSGSSAPPRSVPSTRRFGTPGPEEFPCLNRVNRPHQAEESHQVSSQQQSTQVSYATASAASTAVPNAGSTHQQQRTAASVLQQRPVTQRIFGKMAGTDSAPGDAASSSMRIHESAFPALGAADAVARGSRNMSAEKSEHVQVDHHHNSLPADLSMRVGPVWGGAAARAHERAGRKRGPGKGQGKRPASPPKPVVLNTSDFLNIRGGSSSSSDNFSRVGRSDASRRDPSPRESTQNTPRKNKVIDVVEISRARQKAAAKSNLPKIGGSGYGFAWDRKKVQRKKREIKEGASEKVSKSSVSNIHSSLPLDSASGLPATESSEKSKASPAKIYDPSADTGVIEDAIQSIHIDETTTAPTSDSGEDPQNFDPYAYVKNDTPADDMVTSFLGGTK